MKNVRKQKLESEVYYYFSCLHGLMKVKNNIAKKKENYTF